MIEITFKGDKDIELDVKGHAGYGPLGQDVVCAGVSTVVQGLSVMLDKLYRSGRITKLENVYASGKAHIKVSDYSNSLAWYEVITCFEMAMAQLELIQGAFSDYVSIKYK